MEAMIIQAETAARSAWTGTQVREECMGRARGLLALSVLETKGFHQRLFLYIVCLFSLLHKQERGKRDCRDSPSSCFGVNYSFKWYPLFNLSDFRFVLLEKERNARAYVPFTSSYTTAHFFETSHYCSFGATSNLNAFILRQFACMPFWALLCAFARILPLID
jgi:hypothetical protein